MLRTLGLGLGLLVVGCGGSTPPPAPPPANAKEPAPTATEPAAPPAPPERKVGTLAPSAIQAVIRTQFKALRGCYEEGLKKDPSLAGPIAVRFVITEDGKVEDAKEDQPATRPDPGVVRCVVDAFSGFRFPTPEGGIVTVVYPIVFAPSGAGDEMATCKRQTGEEKDGIRTMSLTCDGHSLKVTDMPAPAVDEKFANAILTGFEQQSPGMTRTRATRKYGDRDAFITTVDGKTYVSMLLVTQVVKDRALAVSCLDEANGGTSKRCSTLVEVIVKREFEAQTPKDPAQTPAPGPTGPKGTLPMGGTGF